MKKCWILCLVCRLPLARGSLLDTRDNSPALRSDWTQQWGVKYQRRATLETDDALERQTSVAQSLESVFDDLKENLVEFLVRMFVMPHIRLSGY